MLNLLRALWRGGRSTPQRAPDPPVSQTLVLQPVVEVSKDFSGVFDWVPEVEQSRFVTLDGSADDQLVLRVLGTIIGQTVSFDDWQPGSRLGLARSIQMLLSEDFRTASGGMLVRTDSVELVPGCCSWLEEWGYARKAVVGADEVWWGHNPSMFIQSDGEMVRIWQGDSDIWTGHNWSRLHVEAPWPMTPPDIAVLPSTFAQALLAFERDLEAFAQRLGRWSRTHPDGLPDLEPLFRRGFIDI